VHPLYQSGELKPQLRQANADAVSLFEAEVKGSKQYEDFMADFPFSAELHRARGPFVSITGQQVASTLVPVHIHESEKENTWCASFRLISKETYNHALRRTKKWYNSLPDKLDDDESILAVDDSDDEGDHAKALSATDALRLGRDLFLQGCTGSCKNDFKTVVTDTTWKLPRGIKDLLGHCISFEFMTDDFDRGAQEMHDFLLK
jgi:hypothetical protein